MRAAVGRRIGDMRYGDHHRDTDTARDNIQVHVIQPQSNSDVHVHDIEDTLPLKDISNEIANLQKQNEHDNQIEFARMQ